MADTGPVSGPAVLDAEPVVDDWGEVVRLVTPITPIPVVITGDSATVNNGSLIALTGLSQVAWAASATFKGGSIQNVSDNVLYVKLGAACSAVDYSRRLEPYDAINISETWKGAVTMFSTGATGSAAITDLQP